MISDRELWQRAKPVFDELADMEHDIRQARLKQIARADPELAAVLERLLDADHASEGALRDYSFGGGSARDRGANSTPPAQAFGPGA
ncbi:MAG TPA: hypothetical protein VKZ41_10500, partial [Gemmatimonadales bacterium]|nr:hypothetical protein [Gemmatimonadales bacterium]